MMRRFLIFLILTGVTGVAISRPGVFYFYVGSFTSEGGEGITLCSLSTETGEAEMLRVFKGIDNPNFLRKSPDGKFLYVVVRGPQQVNSLGGFVTAYRILENKDIEFINKQSSLGRDPCYTDVSPDGKWVAVANYGGGSVALFAVQRDGSLLPASRVTQHQGSGPDKIRQTRAYAHSIRFRKYGNVVDAADLGTDKLYAYRVDEAEGCLLPVPHVFTELPPGSGPRHFEFSDDVKFCYVVNELNSTVTVCKNTDDKLSVIQTISALPDTFRGVSYCADIHVSPDGKMVYASNRGHNSLVVFQRGETGKLAQVIHVPVGGNWPRNFSIDPAGKFMLVANQRSNNITIFRLINGIPVFTGRELKIPVPVCIEFL